MNFFLFPCFGEFKREAIKLYSTYSLCYTAFNNLIFTSQTERARLGPLHFRFDISWPPKDSFVDFLIVSLIIIAFPSSFFIVFFPRFFLMKRKTRLSRVTVMQIVCYKYLQLLSFNEKKKKYEFVIRHLERPRK
jgi:hypothetical protein